jgi:hypothetical protein
MSANAHMFESTQQQLVYAYTRTTGKAAAQILPFYDDEKNRINLQDIPHFVRILERAFGDHDRKAKAQQKMSALRQANRPFADYLADFLALRTDTGFNNDALVSYLDQGLSREMVDRMSYETRPDDLYDYIELLQTIDSKMRQAKERDTLSRRSYASSSQPQFSTRPAAAITTRPSAPAFNRPLPQPAVAVAPASRPVPVFRARPFPAQVIGQPQPRDPDAMEIDQSRQRGPLSAEERQYRMTNRLCLYCGGPGHLAIGCPVRPVPTRLAEATVCDHGDEHCLDKSGNVQSTI